MGIRGSPMETCSSGEELTVKPRKPYTITKQRERWTDEEHNRFLEALKLYGRAWQRIEEHIGTKTAVQIRSHAQKFFSKLEKESLSKGIPLGQALDIDIPPPRPKRKPNNPYPRKTCVGTIPSSKEGNGKNPLSSSTCQNEAPHLKNGAHLEKIVGIESLERSEEIFENGNCSEVLALFQDGPCVSVSSAQKRYMTPSSFRKFVPYLKEVDNKPEKDEASLTVKENKELTQCTDHCVDMDICRLEGHHINSQINEAPKEMSPRHKEAKKAGKTHCELQGTRSNAKAAFHPIEENNENSAHCANSNSSNVTSVPKQSEVPVYPIPPFNDPSLSTTSEKSAHKESSSFQPELPAFGQFTVPCNHQDAYRSLLNLSSTFSNFIMSSLLQNPAAYAAACFASSCWPSVAGETVNSAPDVLNSGTLEGQVSTTPNLATIAAATVAAATAWWATHGFFPFCHPLLSTGFSFSQGPSTLHSHSPKENEERQYDHAQAHGRQDEHIVSPESTDALVMQRSSSKSLPLTSSDSDESGGGERSGGTDLKNSDVKEFALACDGGFNDHGNEPKCEKNTDSLSCGSNKSFNIEKETNIASEKDGTNKEAEQQASFGETNKESEKRASFSETNCRRFKSSGSANESWKEVSEEGRLAFQALFSREVLPQSFSPPVQGGMTNLEERTATPPPLNCKRNFFEDVVIEQFPSIESSSSKSDNHSDKSILTSDGYGSFKSKRTGFKPYKRCSMEAKEDRARVGDEKSNKRPCLEGKASTR